MVALFLAYSTVFVLLLLYVVQLTGRLGRLEREINRLKNGGVAG